MSLLCTLSKQQRDELNELFLRTPNSSVGHAASGEHYKLVAILRRCGYTAKDRWEAFALADKLLMLGWVEEGGSAEEEPDDDFYAGLAGQD